MAGVIKYRVVGDGYEALDNYTYYSPRYNKSITVEKGFFSDGATDAPDIDTDAWWYHDVLCRYGRWDDNSLVTNWQASTVLYDVLKRDGYTVRAPLWRTATYLLGGGACRWIRKKRPEVKPRSL